MGGKESKVGKIMWIYFFGGIKGIYDSKYYLYIVIVIWLLSVKFIYDVLFDWVMRFLFVFMFN